MRIILNGYAGRMGKAVIEICQTHGIEIIAGIDQKKIDEPFATYASLQECQMQADVLVDFSNHDSTFAVADFAESHCMPVVIATTGQTEDEQARIQSLSKTVPVFQSSNMSFGISILSDICKEITSAVGTDADIEIIEKHHNQKKDAPSGTALSIAHEIQESLDDKGNLVFDRSTRHEKRVPREIGISSVRAGNIVGEHEVLFAWGNEILSVKHTALGREVFAEGALRAAAFIISQTPGLYSMKDLLKEAGK